MFDLKKLLQGQNPFGNSSSTPQPASTAQPKTKALLAQSARDNDFTTGLIKNVGNLGKSLVSGVQQGIGNVGDIALQAGGTIGSIGAQTNPFLNQQRRDAQVVEQLKNTEMLRNQLKAAKTVTGESYNVNPDYQPTGDFLRDSLAVGGRALQTGLDATTFLNPTTLLAKGVQDMGTKQLLKEGLQQAALYGGAQGAATGAESYGANGDLGQAIKSGVTTGLVSGLTAGGLNTIAGGSGVVARNAVPTAKKAVKAVEQANPQIKELDNTLIQYQKAFDIETDPTRRAQINQGIAQLNAQRRNTLSRGSIQVPGGKKYNTVEEAYQAQYGYRPDSSELGQLQYMAPEKYSELLNSVSKGGAEELPIIGTNLSSEVSKQPLPASTAKPVLTEADQSRSIVPGQVPNQPNTESLTPSQIDNSGNSLPINNTRTTLSQGKQSRFASQTAPNSGNLSDDLAQRVRESAPDYNPVTNQGSLEDSISYLKERGVDNASNDVLSRLDSKKASSQDIADGLATANALDLRGDEASLRVATEIYDKLSSSLTKAGQTVQAAKLINRRTGSGLLFDAQRQLKRTDVELTPKDRQSLTELAKRVDQVDTLPNLTKVEKDATKSQVIAEMQKEVNKLIPSDFVDKAVGAWKAGLLTGIRTTTGGALSNALFRGLREVSRPGAVLADIAASLFTGKRSAALTTKGAWSGTTEGLSKAAKYLKSGVDERAFTADGKYIDREINFKNKALGAYVNGVFRVMGAADRPFYYSQFKNSIAEATIVEAKNLKLKGKAFDDYVAKGLSNPSEEATQYATNVAEQSVLANDTLLSNGVNGVRQSIERLQNPVVRGAAKATLGVLAPFTKVPSAFLSRVIDFTPIGAVKEVIMQAGKRQLDQAKLVQAISEAGTGTGLIYLGAELANNDLLTGNYPNDPTEQARWKAEGITPNSVRVGDKYYSLNYAGPVGALFNVGKSITDSIKDGAGVADSLVAGGTQLATGTLEQSFLSGISGALDAIQDPQRYAANFVKSQAGSVVPTLINDIGNVTDETQRQANNAGEAILSRIPGARTTLNAKSDTFGNELKQANDSKIGRLIDPLRPSKAIETDLTNELDRLKDVNEPIFPTTDKTIKVGGETLKLDADQQKEYNDAVGKETKLLWNNIVRSPEYQSLSDSDKKKTLANAQTDINALSKKQFLEGIGNTDLAKKIDFTERQEKYALGTIDPKLWIPREGAPTVSKSEASTTKVATTKASTAKKSTSTKSKFDYAKRLEALDSTARSNQDAVRKLVYGSKIQRKKIA